MSGFRRKKKIKFIISIIIIILFGQFVFSKVIAEPYPSIVFPGFPKVIKGDTLTYSKKEIFYYDSSGDSAQVTLKRMLGSVPDQFHGNVLNTLINREKENIKSKSWEIGIFTYELQQKIKFSDEEFNLLKEWILNNVGKKDISEIKIFTFEYQFLLRKGGKIPGKNIKKIDEITL